MLKCNPFTDFSFCDLVLRHENEYKRFQWYLANSGYDGLKLSRSRNLEEDPKAHRNSQKLIPDRIQEYKIKNARKKEFRIEYKGGRRGKENKKKSSFLFDKKIKQKESQKTRRKGKGLNKIFLHSSGKMENKKMKGNLKFK